MTKAEHNQSQKQAAELDQKLEDQLGHINDVFESDPTGDSITLTTLEDALTVKINDFEVSLMCMDTYDAFCRFLKAIVDEEHFDVSEMITTLNDLSNAANHK